MGEGSPPWWWGWPGLGNSPIGSGPYFGRGSGPIFVGLLCNLCSPLFIYGRSRIAGLYFSRKYPATRTTNIAVETLSGNAAAGSTVIKTRDEAIERKRRLCSIFQAFCNGMCGPCEGV